MTAATAEAPTNRGALVRLDSVTFEYAHGGRRALKVLDTVSLSIAPGKVAAIVGPSGCGKSTLLSIVTDDVAPRSGSAQIRSNGAARRPEIGVVFQEPALLPWRTVRENVLLPLELLQRGETERARTVLDLVGLADFADAYPHQLSGGMQSRAALARAIVNDPELVVLDEPFGALDEVTSHELLAELSALFSKLQTTAIFVTHTLEQAVFLADEIFVLSRRPGRIVGSVRVDEPQPRELSFLSSKGAFDHLKDVRTMLRERA